MKLFNKFKDEILKEQEEDVNQTSIYLNSYPPKKLAQLGYAILNLNITNVRTGISGKTILELQLDKSIANGEIDTSTMKTGDIVKIAKMIKESKKENKKKNTDGDKDEDELAIEAVVVKVTNQQVTLSVDGSINDDKTLVLYNNTNDNSKLWIVKLANSITYDRMIKTMNKVINLQESDQNDIHRILLGGSKFNIRENTDPIVDFFNSGLNQSQKDAINFSINQSNFSIIFGPPGTGKTMTIIELIQQLTKKGEKILVCGPSNISVDTILERLGKNYKSNELIRIGHPARLLPVNLQHSLDVLSKSYGKEVIQDLEKDIQSTLSKIKKTKRYAERKALYQELKMLKKELIQRERKIIYELLNGAKVVCSTLHGAGSLILKQSQVQFDTIIIDEVSQSMEPQCWIPLLINNNFKRLVIAGDNMQLPPTLMNKDSILGQTLFDRIIKFPNGEKIKNLLNIQYRMNNSIMKFPSMQLYENKLISDESVKNITISDLPNVESSDETNLKCIWYDTQGGDFPEQKLDSIGDSKYNEMEILIVKAHVNKLLELGVEPKDIGIIAPYSAQVQILKKQINSNNIEISTVDGFQGREKEIIILTLVRSNDAKEIGFLNEERRLNVAITRAKRQLCVIGDLQLMNDSGFKFLKNWSKYVEDGYEDNEVEPYEIVYPNIDDYLEN
ncbi:uncharacterized protein KGF55_003034 [Candida pseudojiufengensis]|uniref:uncharacterized protein n=1 Tax=Candida pseudojiufengensis TaxID=497109 RepID=UPI002225A113|nr:uncharacterized protein KGF55_003034 [Candida pseudojiufengensis]KAI5963242.1 hypothetical protein KGF55_003034 [Candida pseudojiufengensis]